MKALTTVFALFFLVLLMAQATAAQPRQLLTSFKDRVTAAQTQKELRKIFADASRSLEAFMAPQDQHLTGDEFCDLLKVFIKHPAGQNDIDRYIFENYVFNYNHNLINRLHGRYSNLTAEEEKNLKEAYLKNGLDVVLEVAKMPEIKDTMIFANIAGGIEEMVHFKLFLFASEVQKAFDVLTYLLNQADRIGNTAAMFALKAYAESPIDDEDILKLYDSLIAFDAIHSFPLGLVAEHFGPRDPNPAKRFYSILAHRGADRDTAKGVGRGLALSKAALPEAGDILRKILELDSQWPPGAEAWQGTSALLGVAYALQNQRQINDANEIINLALDHFQRWSDGQTNRAGVANNEFLRVLGYSIGVSGSQISRLPAYSRILDGPAEAIRADQWLRGILDGMVAAYNAQKLTAGELDTLFLKALSNQTGWQKGNAYNEVKRACGQLNPKLPDTDPVIVELKKVK